MKRYLGKLAVHTVREGDGRMPMNVGLPGITREDLSALQRWHWSPELSLDPAEAVFHLEVRSYVLQIDGLNVLIDSCCGNGKTRSVPWAHQLQSGWLDDLQRQGFAPEDIHLVLCTHLHADHVGWNTRLHNGRWVPTFPNARYVFSRRDFDFFATQTHEPHNREAYEDSVLPVVATGQADIVDSDHLVHREIGDGLWLQDAAGHSPGCVVVNAQRGGARLAFMGDVIHHPVQIHRPDVAFFADEDGPAACATRERLLAEAADDGAVLLPAHFPDPPACRVHRSGRYFSGEWLARG